MLAIKCYVKLSLSKFDTSAQRPSYLIRFLNVPNRILPSASGSKYLGIRTPGSWTSKLSQTKYNTYT